jgi:hypothetical protein
MTDPGSDAPTHVPTSLQHRHGLKEWWPMLPERSAETTRPGEAPTERFYRCQFVGCGEMVRLDAGDLRGAEAARPG